MKTYLGMFALLVVFAALMLAMYGGGWTWDSRIQSAHTIDAS